MAKKKSGDVLSIILIILYFLAQMISTTHIGVGEVKYKDKERDVIIRDIDLNW